MLDPNFIQELTDYAEQLSSELSGEVIQKIVERMIIRMNKGRKKLLSSIDKWQLESLQEGGMLLDEIAKVIAKYTPLMENEVKKQFQYAAVRNVNYDNEVFATVGISPVKLAQSPSLIRILERGYSVTNATWSNLTKTTATRAYATFIAECDKAYLRTQSGIPYTEAYYEAIRDISKVNADVVYPSGHTDTIETATLRCIRTGISQTCGEVTAQRMNEEQWDTVLVSAHLGARTGDGGQNPGNHAWWQGKFYSLSGAGKFPSLSVTGYGTIEGLCGVNCRHSFGPGDGVHNPYEHFDSKENQRAYVLSQRQRALERRIRKLKKECVALKEAQQGDIPDEVKGKLTADYQKKAQSLMTAQNSYKEFCKYNNLRPLEERLKVADYGYSEAKSAKAAAKALTNRQKFDTIIEELKTNRIVSKSAVVNYPPKIIDISDFVFDDKHINAIRKHNVTKQQAIEWVKSSKVSFSVWKGTQEKFFGLDGAVYVDIPNKIIKTAYSKEEFDAHIVNVMEELKRNGF